MRPLIFALLGAFLIISGVTAILSLTDATFPPFASSTPESNAALSYAKGAMLWYQGPSVASERVVAVRNLPAAIAALPRSTQQDVNVPALVREYGPDRSVALVVLRGTYNSLPPDEGVPTHGDVIVLLDPRTHHVLLLTI